VSWIFDGFSWRQIFFLLFVLMPIIEIAVLIQIGGALGLLPTLAIIVATAILGSIMLRQQGMATLAKARGRMASGQLPAEQLMEGVLLLIGGVAGQASSFAFHGWRFYTSWGRLRPECWSRA